MSMKNRIGKLEETFARMEVPEIVKFLRENHPAVVMSIQNENVKAEKLLPEERKKILDEYFLQNYCSKCEKRSV